MAASSNSTSTKRPRPQRPRRGKGSGLGPLRGSRWPYWLALVLGVAALVWWYFGEQARGYTGTAAAYAARVACSCHYVAGRSVKDCEKDKLDGMDLVTLTADAEAKSLTARFPLIASETAYYRPGYGCVLEPQD